MERFWLAAALGLTVLFIGRTMAPAFAPGFVIQDDARQHVFWMANFRDPELFRDDLIADYFRAVAPPAYSALYRALSPVVDPLLASKLLPPLLGLATALFVFLLVRRLHPAPAGAFLATVLSSWYTWQYADLASGTPRAFQLPLLAAQLWALAGGRLVVAVGLVVLATLFYPSAGLLGVALLAVRLVGRRGWRPTLTRSRSAWLAALLATALVGGLLLLLQHDTAPYGPVVTAAEARKMDEFREDGRSTFFSGSRLSYWLKDPRSGFDLAAKDERTGQPILYAYLAVGALLPLFVLFRGRLAAARQLSGRSAILLQLLVASLGLFFLAHALLFRLYLPSRYVKSSVPLALAIAAGLALAILVEAIGARARARLLAGGLALLCALGVALYPPNPSTTFAGDPNPALSAYLQTQPKHVLVAGATRDTDPLPAWANRRVLTSREYLNPYHLGFYREVARRTEALVDAYYARSPADLAAFVARYGVDLLLVNRAAFAPATALEVWSKDFEPYSSRVLAKFRSTARFALRDAARTCSAFDDGQVLVVPASCFVAQR